ncbi:MAG: FRG domain-containing protein [Oscillospiraceae bacterium]|nr:FRG domain-containing protein [Oscillospiraceae bacterium]
MKIKKIKGCITHNKDELKLIGHWPPSADPSEAVPMYHVESPQAFNQLVGYAKFINGSNGTVLYRGQSKNHESLLPSGARKNSSPVPDETIDAIREDHDIRSFFGLDVPEIRGWEQYQSVLIESVLQHYGANTYCMDFVDNHWCSLWFGLYKFIDNHYVKRSGPDEKLYIYFYLADTNSACVHGMYIGEDTYTVDLRKALPSTFSRPSAQHGWIVRKHRREACSYDDRVIGVVEVNADDAAKWLGEGELLSQENFFPDYSYDQGYKVLLSRQQRSGVTLRWSKILPANTICNYHYFKTFFTTHNGLNIPPRIEIKTNTGKTITNITGLYSLLLEKGWTKDTCVNESVWNEDNPVIGQSLPTALLVHKCFGGDILYFKYSNRTHHFNFINGCYIDLAYEELNSTRKKDYPPEKTVNLGDNPKHSYATQYDKLKQLVENCGLTTVKLKPPHTKK